jgi:NADPH-dependent 2,4-dienoyl-CoA reductase/sulfur reductase-like enzyme
MPRSRIVVIGGAFSGPAAAARARETDERAEILLLERAPDVSYAIGGLAHALGGEVASLAKLDREKARFFRDTYNVEVRTGVEVVGIDAARRVVDASGRNVPYDRLVVATGARSIVPPIQGLSGAKNVFRFRRLADLKGILRHLERGAKRVVILGGGYFGVEAADGFLRRRPKLRVTLVERDERILKDFSPRASLRAQESLEAAGVRVLANRKLVSVSGGRIARELRFDDGTTVATDLVVVAAGVEPRTELMKSAGARTHADGSLWIDSRCATSLPDVYACGVAVAVEHAVTGKTFWTAQAAVADRTAQVAGANAAGGDEKLGGMLGTAIVRAADVVLARTGWTGGSEPEVAVARIHAPNHDPFLPGVSEVSVEIHFDRRQGRLLGAEVVGGPGTDKRVDVLAAAILGKLGASDLARIDLAYQAPFAVARDAVNVAGTVASAARAGKARAYSAAEVEGAKNLVVVDVDRKRSRGTPAIPLEELRGRLAELRRLAEKGPVVFLSETGRRGYLAARIAADSGIACGYLSGGTR